MLLYMYCSPTNQHWSTVVYHTQLILYLLDHIENSNCSELCIIHLYHVNSCNDGGSSSSYGIAASQVGEPPSVLPVGATPAPVCATPVPPVV